MHTHAYTHMHTRAQTHTHMHTHERVHMHMHTHAHTHAHTCSKHTRTWPTATLTDFATFGAYSEADSVFSICRDTF